MSEALQHVEKLTQERDTQKNQTLRLAHSFSLASDVVPKEQKNAFIWLTGRAQAMIDMPPSDDDFDEAYQRVYMDIMQDVYESSLSLYEEYLGDSSNKQLNGVHRKHIIHITGHTVFLATELRSILWNVITKEDEIHSEYKDVSTKIDGLDDKIAFLAASHSS